MRGGAIFLLAAVAFAQPAFDVASLKPSPPVPPGELYVANLGTIRYGEVTITNGTLADSIKFAWGLVSDDQITGPDWIKNKDVRFDLRAKAAPSTPRDQLLSMLQTLLRERFRLEMRTTTRNFAHLILTLAKDGPKMREVDPDAPHPAMSYRIGHITHHAIAMTTLAMLLSRQMRQLVLDRTGLKGVYDVDLQWIPENAPENADTGPSIFRAVQEQLGLKLERRKDGVEVLVVVRADRTPAEN